MKAKSLLAAGAISLLSVGLAVARTYDIQVLTPTMAGSAELKPGEYKVKIEGSQASFKNVQGDKTVTVPVKVQSGEKKFGATRVETVNQNGMDTIQSIDLGDSNTRVTIGQ